MNKLKELREKKGISINQCALETGISARTIIRYEKGYTGQLYYMQKLARYYDVPIDYLINGHKSGSAEYGD